MWAVDIMAMAITYFCFYVLDIVTRRRTSSQCRGFPTPQPMAAKAVAASDSSRPRGPAFTDQSRSTTRSARWKTRKTL